MSLMWPPEEWHYQDGEWELYLYPREWEEWIITSSDGKNGIYPVLVKITSENHDAEPRYEERQITQNELIEYLFKESAR